MKTKAHILNVALFNRFAVTHSLTSNGFCKTHFLLKRLQARRHGRQANPKKLILAAQQFSMYYYYNQMKQNTLLLKYP